MIITVGGDNADDFSPENSDGAEGGGMPDARDMESANSVRAGTLLLASTDLTEPTFARSVIYICLLYTSPSPRDATLSRMPSSA